MNKNLIIVVTVLLLAITFWNKPSYSQGATIQVAELRSGWNLFSTYMIPDTADPMQLFAPVITQGMLIKNSNGNVFWGFYGVNQIGDITVGEGYTIRLDMPYSLSLSGTQINPETLTYTIPPGWSYLGYVREHPSIADSILSNLNFQLLKNENGLVNWPQYNLSQIDYLKPGKAYQVLSSSSQQFTYRNNNFWCGVDLLTDNDGNEYKTIKLNQTCWMSENLNSGITINSSTASANNNLIEKYCYNNDSVNCTNYGGLYKWNELMNYNTSAGSQGICPTNWHIPSDSEWKALELFLGMDSLFATIIGWRGTNEGDQLKTDGTSGFEAKFGGQLIPSQSYTGLAASGYFYTSSVFNGENVIHRQLADNNSGINRYFGSKTYAYSVRCVLNDSITCLTIPTSADAGNDQLGLINGTTNLEANIPLEGLGMWNIISGSGGFLSDPGNPASVFTGIGGTDYTLTWNISTACDISIDTVHVTFSSVGDSCGQVFIDARDGQAYHTVQIGAQCWMADNLNIGVQISCLCNQFDDNLIEKYCYDNIAANCDSLGATYQWGEVMNYDTTSNQGICPAGWHVPSDEEFKILETELGMTSTELENLNAWRGSTEGDQLKVGGSSGFDGKLSGRRSNGTFSLKNIQANYWLRNNGNTASYSRSLLLTDGTIGRFNNVPNSYGYAVRCIKN